MRSRSSWEIQSRSGTASAPNNTAAISRWVAPSRRPSSARKSEDESASPRVGKSRWVGARTTPVERAPKAQRSGHPDFKQPIERQKNRRRIYVRAVQMHAQFGAEPLDDIVVTFAGQYRIKRHRLGLESWMPKLRRQSGQGNDAGQNPCCPDGRFGLIRRLEEVTPSAGRTHPPRLDQGSRGAPFLGAFPDLLRIQDGASRIEKQDREHRMSGALCMPQESANTRGS